MQGFNTGKNYSSSTKMECEEEYPIDKDATRVLWNPYDDSRFLIVHQDDTLQFYGIEQEDNSL